MIAERSVLDTVDHFAAQSVSIEGTGRIGGLPPTNAPPVQGIRKAVICQASC